MTLPHDPVDLQLAPVALALDKELAALAELDPKALQDQVLLAANREPADLASPEAREQVLVWMITRFVSLHGWEVSVDERGVRLSHHDHSLVLGIPPTVRDFLTDGHRAELG